MNKSKRDKTLLLIVGLILLLSGSYFAFKVHIISSQQVEVKSDYSIVNNVSFGLLSVSRWRDQITSALTQKIGEFNLSQQQKRDIQKEIEGTLHSLITKAITIIDKPTKSLGGKLKKLAFKAFIDTTSLHQQVPIFAKQILAELNKTSTKEKLKNIAESKLHDWGKQIYDSDLTRKSIVIDSVLSKYNTNDPDIFEQKSISLLNNQRKQTYLYSFGLLGIIAIIIILWLLLINKKELHTVLFVVSVAAALILLIVGATTTMIELDARIASLTFNLVGTTVSFKNQVLFFQSKSILDVVNLLIKSGKWDMIIVGILILCFSIIFPITKLISTCIYLISKEKYRSNKLIYFFAFNSGKWSMADVMVVAIMMAYIGFNGVVSSQLSSLNVHSDTITSITTNNTSLQPGYIVFVAYVLFGLILSMILKRITKEV